MPVSSPISSQTTVVRATSSARDSKHNMAAQASAGRLISLLRNSYPQIKSTEARQRAHQASLIQHLDKLAQNKNHSVAKDETIDSSIRSTLQMAEYILTNTPFPAEQKIQVVTQMRTIANLCPGFAWTHEIMQKKEAVAASPAETLNLVCQAIFDSTQFFPKEPTETALSDQVASLFIALLALQEDDGHQKLQPCATGHQHTVPAGDHHQINHTLLRALLVFSEYSDRFKEILGSMLTTRKELDWCLNIPSNNITPAQRRQLLRPLLLNCFVDDPRHFRTFLISLSPSDIEHVICCLGKGIQQIIPNSETLCFLLKSVGSNGLTEPQRDQALNSLENQLPFLITRTQDVVKLLSLFSKSQGVFILHALRDQLPRMIINLGQLSQLLVNLDSIQIPEVLEAMQVQLPLMLPNQTVLVNFIHQNAFLKNHRAFIWNAVKHNANMPQECPFPLTTPAAVTARPSFFSAQATQKEKVTENKRVEFRKKIQ